MAGERPPERMIVCATIHGGQTERPAASFRFRPAAYGLAVRDGRVLLGRSAFSGRLDIPGGAVHPWEALADGLRREFAEETGVTPEVGEQFHFAESYVAIFNHAFHSLRFYFRVHVPADAALRPQREEMSALDWIDVARVPAEDFAPGDAEIVQRALRL